MRLFRLFVLFMRCLPAFVVYRFSESRTLVNGDIERWRQRQELSWDGNAAFFALMKYEEFRSLIYYRLPATKCFAWLAGRGAPALYINTPKIGAGLYFQHGFATIINAQSIGRNCHINQQVTVGFHGAGRAPVIGDNVSIRAGAMVIGDVTIGDNVVVGAGAVVVKSVPANCVVVGNPAYIVRRDGKTCRETL